MTKRLKNVIVFILIFVTAVSFLPAFATAAAPQGTETEMDETDAEKTNPENKTDELSLEEQEEEEEREEERKELLAELTKPVLKKVASRQGHTMDIRWEYVENAEGYDVYRKTGKNGTFQFLAHCDQPDRWDLRYNLEEEGLDDLVSYTDQKLKVGTTYYYRICPTVSLYGEKLSGEASNTVGALSRIDAPVIKKAVSSKKGINQITWSKVSGAKGYSVYVSKSAGGKYKKLKTLKADAKRTYTHKKLKNGTPYYYKVYAFWNLSGKSTRSNEPEAYQKYCDYYTHAWESDERKCERIFGAKGQYKYKTLKQARKRMTTIKIKVWDANKKRKKYTRTFSISVNKALAPSVKKMFQEIYKSKERFPIHDIGCFSWRGKGSNSEHCKGMAFDINSNENYLIDNGKVQAGSFWKPKKNRYSIPLKCELVRILEKYGFRRGLWGTRRDYMHFSYFGN